MTMSDDERRHKLTGLQRESTGLSLVVFTKQLYGSNLGVSVYRLNSHQHSSSSRMEGRSSGVTPCHHQDYVVKKISLSY